MADTMDSIGMYNKLRKDPLKESRCCTNVIFLGIFLIIFTVWIGLLINAFGWYSYDYTNGTLDHRVESLMNKIIPVTRLAHNEKFNDILSYYTILRHTSSYFLTIWHVLFGVFLILALLFSLKFIPKVDNLIIVGTITYLVVQQVVRTYVVCKSSIKKLNEHPSFEAKSINKSEESNENSSSETLDVTYTVIYSLIPSLISVLIVIVILVSIKRVGLKAVLEILEKTLQALFYFPSLCLVGIITFIFQLITLTATILFIQWTTKIAIATKLFVLIFGSYLALFITNFGKMVVFETIATWNWMQNGKIPTTTIFSSFFTVIRYHLGSIAFGSTLILPFFQAVYVAFKTGSYGAQKGFDILMVFLCKVIVVLGITDFALIQTSAHGLSFLPAVKRTFHLMVKNSHLSLMLLYMAHNLLRLVATISYVLTILTWDLFNLRRPIIDRIFSSMFDGPDSFFDAFIFIMLPALLIVEASVTTLLLCALEDKEDNDENEAKQCSNDTAML